MIQRLAAFDCHGINTDSLGNYLCGLGLLSAVAHGWPGLRGCWRDGHFVLLGETTSSEEMLNRVVDLLQNRWEPTPYERWWVGAQKKDTKAKASSAIWAERNRRSLKEVRLLDAHIVGTGRNRFNPVLGTGGNVGKRDLAKLQKDAAKLLSDPQREKWLHATLTGEATIPLPDLQSAGTWFVFANKTYNSGQEWYREGRLSPWSVLFALEGAFLLAGDVAKRLGAKARPYAAFPFTCDPLQPANDGCIGLSKAEFWAPLWYQPATFIEVVALLQRGMARLGGRAAKAPHEFAIAARAAGVDAGVAEFVRYELRQTTSSQVYEAIPRGHITVSSSRSATMQVETATEAQLLMQLIASGWLDKLPYEPRDSKQKGKFVGLRGPIEAAIVKIAESPSEPERWRELLLLLAAAQARIDRNKNLRDRCIPLPLLRAGWFARAWPGITQPEIIIARSIASIGAGSDHPFLVNVFGVDVVKNGRGILFPKARPQRSVWNSGDPGQAMTQVLQRRLIDADTMDPIPLDATRRCPAALVYRLLRGDPSLDLELIAHWLPALSLIDWRIPNHSKRIQSGPHSPADGAWLLHALLRPLFHPRALRIWEKNPDRVLPHAGLALRILHLVRHGAIDEAVQLARNRYLAWGRAIVVPPVDLRTTTENLAVALLVPMHDLDVEQLLVRWFQPSKNNPS
ncbi:MAG: type I-U CRISPR-associated protein Csx17 [Acidobacteriota bacterium]|jgi:CRISPR-associated protein Csx17